MRVAWQPRFPPLPATLAVARGACARALARRLATFPADRLAALRAGADDDLLVVAGAEHQLPWVDGVSYLGVDVAAPGLRLPTALAPSLPADLLQRLLVGRAAAASLLAVLPDADGGGLVTIAVGELGPLRAEALAALGGATEPPRP